jgi:hypothetical protein
MPKAKPLQARPANNEIRRIMLQYFYDRNKNATSARGKRGSAVKISDVKKELKATHGLTQQEVQSNLTYLISQGWVEEDAVEKTFTAPGEQLSPPPLAIIRSPLLESTRLKDRESSRCRNSKELRSRRQGKIS